MDQSNKTTKRRVMIGTPCYDGRVDVWYTNSLVNTIKLAPEYNIDVTPVWVSFDALIQRARNDTIQLAVTGNYDDLVWIDSDIEWKPEWFYKLLEYPHDVVGGTYPKKGDREEYVIRQIQKRQVDPDTRLMEVDGLGTGFVKMSKRSMKYLWDHSESYIDPKDGQERKMIFNVVLKDGDMVSEDIHMFNTLQAGGFKIWLDTAMTCNHIGPKKFTGNFVNWWRKANRPTSSRQL